ncbi:MAG TPA: tetratricopeptide repeat protein [Pyrinomonadaceae bacterium]|nr:tetratricopeptide repeat protein [Pyrinomonadaceae bacterium]
MPGFASLHLHSIDRFLFILLGILLLPFGVNAQGSGRSTTGTGGVHIIQGYVFFPSGRRAEGTIEVKLQSYNSGELSVFPDSSGSFTFSNLAPGNYTVTVNAGDEYEIAREGVYIDTDANTSRTGARVPSTSRRYTVMVHLQPKTRSGHAKPSVVNAALAEVPDKPRKLYEQGVERARADDAAKAAESLKQAVLLYPNFPLALNELGVQYLKLRQVNKAVEVLKQACKLSPEAFTPQLNLGIALLESKQFGDAEHNLREALKRNNNAPTGHMYLGIALLRLDKFDEAEKELITATQSSGNQLGLASYYLGGLYWRKQDYPHAVEQLEMYLRLTPNAPDAERVRATIKDLRNRTPGSK